MNENVATNGVTNGVSNGVNGKPANAPPRRVVTGKGKSDKSMADRIAALEASQAQLAAENARLKAEKAPKLKLTVAEQKNTKKKYVVLNFSNGSPTRYFYKDELACLESELARIKAFVAENGIDDKG